MVFPEHGAQAYARVSRCHDASDRAPAIGELVALISEYTTAMNQLAIATSIITEFLRQCRGRRRPGARIVAPGTETGGPIDERRALESRVRMAAWEANNEAHFLFLIRESDLRIYPRAFGLHAEVLRCGYSRIDASNGAESEMYSDDALAPDLGLPMLRSTWRGDTTPTAPITWHVVAGP
ncbi:hypothetical protein [Nocardia suismassiliense]|uniref:hypothetical protein n=1 Tax=Nocardia suismassiliense TaxID=2077092 RepID=UPI00131F28EB|nr:hypothetical protein [Nocardia suismassiliense]